MLLCFSYPWYFMFTTRMSFIYNVRFACESSIGEPAPLSPAPIEPQPMCRSLFSQQRYLMHLDLRANHTQGHGNGSGSKQSDPVFRGQQPRNRDLVRAVFRQNGGISDSPGTLYPFRPCGRGCVPSLASQSILPPHCYPDAGARLRGPRTAQLLVG